jgi:hypothetical protein
MIGSECLCVAELMMSIDGEQYDGEQGQYFDDQHDQHEFAEQAKYSMGSSLLSLSLLII